MTLATTCPRCKTSFKVVSDQLKLRRGMVRCGVCQNVFNGLEHLKYVEPVGSNAGARASSAAPITPPPIVASPPLPPAIASSPNPVAAIEHWPNVPAVSSAHEELSGTREASSIEKAFGAKVVATKSTTTSNNQGASDWSQSNNPVPAGLIAKKAQPNYPREPSRGVAQNTTTLLRQDNDLQTAFFLPDRFEAEELARSVTPPRSIKVNPLSDGTDLRGRKLDRSDEAVDFFSSESSQGTTTERASKVGIRIAFIGLGLLACLQVTLLLRNVIAQRFPSARYTLETASSAVGLKVTLPRNLKMLTIESFDVQATARPDILAISAIVRNRASHPVSWPAMELTLSGVDGTPVLRKVITPAQYLEPFMVNNGATGLNEQPIRIGLQTNSITPTGYSVNLFYLN